MINRLFRYRLLVGSFYGIVWGSVMACSGADATGTSAILTTNPYTMVRLNVRAAVMSTVAPYDTLQLVPTAYAADGTVIPLPGPVMYSVSDTAFQVSAAGLVMARHSTSGSQYVVARIQDTAQNVTHADTAYIKVTTSTPVASIARFSIQPLAGDSAVLALQSGTKSLTVMAQDANNNNIAGTLVEHFSSSDVTIATIDSRAGVVSAVAPGTVWLTAVATYYGVTVRDSLRFRIGVPLVTKIIIGSNNVTSGPASRFIPALQSAWVGETVVFVSAYLNDWYEEGGSWGQQYTKTEYAIPLSVVFDDSTDVQQSPLNEAALSQAVFQYPIGNGSGNIGPIVFATLADSAIDDGGSLLFPLVDAYCDAAPYPCAAARTFAKAGTYHYHNAVDGAAGTVTVYSPPQ